VFLSSRPIIRYEMRKGSAVFLCLPQLFRGRGTESADPGALVREGGRNPNGFII